MEESPEAGHSVDEEEEEVGDDQDVDLQVGDQLPPLGAVALTFAHRHAEQDLLNGVEQRHEPHHAEEL